MNETIECPKCHAQTPALVDGECYMCVEERLYPAPPPSAAHAGLLAAWSKWRGYICDEEEPTEAQVAALMAGDAMEVALRAASPSPDLLDLVAKSAEAKNDAYAQRNRLVAALSKVFPAHECRHPDSDTEWEDDWRSIVCIHLPTGQATWHIHDSERRLFTHLAMGENHWDGHDDAEKWRRVAALAASPAPGAGEAIPEREAYAIRTAYLEGFDEGWSAFPDGEGRPPSKTDWMAQRSYGWHHSAARRGAAGGDDE